MTTIKTEPVCTLWVCDDCALARENGEPAPDADREPWNRLPDDDVTIGRRDEHHDCGQTWEERSINEDPCSCDRLDFSGIDCDACGTTLAGGRWAYTLWLPVVEAWCGGSVAGTAL